MQPGFRVFRTRDNTGSISTEISLTPGVAWNDANQGYNFELKRDSTNNNKLRADFFGSGMSLVVEVYRHYSRNVLDYFVHAPRSSAPKGLFGNLDDNKAVEFFRRGDTQHIVYPVDPNRYTQTTDRYVYDGLQTCKTQFCYCNTLSLILLISILLRTLSMKLSLVLNMVITTIELLILYKLCLCM